MRLKLLLPFQSSPWTNTYPTESTNKCYACGEAEGDGPAVCVGYPGGEGRGNGAAQVGAGVHDAGEGACVGFG